MGLELDEKANDTRGEEKMISTEDSKIKVYVVPTNEELMIAKETERIVNK
jgi:acetate kinase